MRGRDQEISFASMVILAFRTRETGHPFLAFCVAWSNFAWSPPGIFTLTSRCTAVMVKPASVFSSVSAAFVSMLSAVMPASPSCAERAMEKQPACAAAINSSGFVPTPFSKRVLKEYCVWLRVPLCVETVPLPSLKPPDQWAGLCVAFCPPKDPVHSISTSPERVKSLVIGERLQSGRIMIEENLEILAINLQGC